MKTLSGEGTFKYYVTSDTVHYAYSRADKPNTKVD